MKLKDRAKPHTDVESYYIQMGPFTRHEDAVAAKQLLVEHYLEPVNISSKSIARKSAMVDPNQRRFALKLLAFMETHPHRCWDKQDLYIYAQEEAYKPATVDHYIYDFVKLGLCKRTEYGSIYLVLDAVATFRAGE